MKNYKVDYGNGIEKRVYDGKVWFVCSIVHPSGDRIQLWQKTKEELIADRQYCIAKGARFP